MSNTDQSCCDPRKMRQFLSGQLSDQDTVRLERHLDDCEPCQVLSEQTAAGKSSWQEAMKMLTDDPWRSYVRESAVSDQSDFNDSGGISLAFQVKQVLQMLQPTDDPQMLGRMGGYEVSGVVGSGGMGIVLKASDRSLDRMVAIKVLAPHLACSAAARGRFEREAKAAAAVIHPNVIAIHAVSNDTELPFLVMPYVRGATLQKRIDDEGALQTVDVLRIGWQVAAGLAAAHQQGLVHRDIKPANILLEDGVERVAITDFGLARAVDDASITKTGVIAGTPQYMSPEQARGNVVDHRTDLFSLGSVLYTLCTGRPPFRGENTFGILRRITDDVARPIRESDPQVPTWLCRLIERLHDKDVDARYQSADQVATLMQQCLAHLQTPNTPLPDELVSEPRWGEFNVFAWGLATRTRLGGIVVLAIFLIIVISIAAMPSSEKIVLPGDSETGQQAVSGLDQSILNTPANDPLQTVDDTGEVYDWDDSQFTSPESIAFKAKQLAAETLIPFQANIEESSRSLTTPSNE